MLTNQWFCLQDVMLSGTNNQSPIPPVLSFSTSSFNQAVSNQPNIAVALTDNLFSALQQSSDGTKDSSNQTSTNNNDLLFNRDKQSHWFLLASVHSNTF